MEFVSRLTEHARHARHSADRLLHPRRTRCAGHAGDTILLHYIYHSLHFLSDAIAEIEGLLEVNRDFCKKQMAEKASPALPTNCAVVPYHFISFCSVAPARRWLHHARRGCRPPRRCGYGKQLYPGSTRCSPPCRDAAHLPLDAVQAVDEGFHFLRRSLFMLMAGFTLMIAAIHGLIPPVTRYPRGVCRLYTP